MVETMTEMVESNVVIGTPRRMTQDELNFINCNDWIEKVMEAMKHGMVRFVVHKNHFSLVELEHTTSYHYNINVGEKHLYSYKMSDVVGLLEDLYYDEDVEILVLKGEFQTKPVHTDED